jgi:hypothetical protein
MSSRSREYVYKVLSIFFTRKLLDLQAIVYVCRSQVVVAVGAVAGILAAGAPCCQ